MITLLLTDTDTDSEAQSEVGPSGYININPTADICSISVKHVYTAV